MVRTFPAAVGLLGLLGLVAPASGQDGPAARFVPREAIDCKVKSWKPELNFDFRFVSRYVVTVRTRDLAGERNRARIVAMVRPLDFEDRQPERFRRSMRLGDVPADQGGKTEFSGIFVMGEGRYTVDWRFQDRYGRGCELQWEVRARLGRGQRDLPLSMERGEIASARRGLFRDEENITDPLLERPLRVKFLINFDIRKRRALPVQTWEYGPLIAFLRAFVRDPRFGEFSVLGYSVQEQRAIFQQALTSSIDFRALGESVETLSPTTVELENLRDGASEQFLDELIVDELLGSEHFDAIVFMGSDSLTGEKVSREKLEELETKILALYHFRSQRVLWRGMAGRLVKSLDGESFRVGRPRDLARAVEKIAERSLERRLSAP